MNNRNYWLPTGNLEAEGSYKVIFVVLSDLLTAFLPFSLLAFLFGKMPKKG
jgi:hypothetical protein